MAERAQIEKLKKKAAAALKDPRVRKAVKKSRQQAGRLARKVGVYDSLVKGRPGAAPKPVAGLVEVTGDDQITGWVSVSSPTAPPTRVSLHLNGLEVGSTWATDVRGLNSWGEVRTFRFRTRDIWAYARTSHKIVVRADGSALPIHGHGMFLNPAADGKRPFHVLKSKLASGHVFSSSGRLQLSKKLDTAWQVKVTGLYDQVSQILAEAYDYVPFVIYGSLLGAVREGGFIGHDIDFDAAFVSRHTDPAAVSAELKQIAFTLIDRGLDVEARTTALHVHHPEQASTRIDLFHLYFDAAGVLSFPFGRAGSLQVRKSDWRGTMEVPFAGRQVVAPVNAEQVVESIYGASWREPQPGFKWGANRQSRAIDARLTLDECEEVYWANFYAKTEYTSGSTFFDLVNARPDTPAGIVDIGCGDGRDAFAFGVAGRRVLGLDRSHIGVRHAAKKAESIGFSGRVRFQACDVGDDAALRAALGDEMSNSPGGPVLFYARFFLHSITTETQEVLMAAIRDAVRPGDMFAAEFRTDKDEANTKVHTKHYRRFQNGPAFGERLAQDYGFEVLFESEGTGLSPYKGEDPELYRVIARRAADARA